MRHPLPTSDQVRQAMDEVLQDAAATGQRPTVRAVERHLGISHPTFYRNYRDLISEYFQARATRWSQPAATIGTNDKLADSEARLRLQVADLHKTVNLYEEAIRQLAIENEALRAQLAETGNVSAMRPVQPARR
jgi:AcrR family transcriptional regulator